VLGIDFTQPFQCEGRSGTVAEQTPKTQAIVRFYAHAGIKRETPTVIPGAHRLRVFTLEQSSPGSCPQKPDADLGLYLGQRFGPQGVRCLKTHAPGGISVEIPLDDHAVAVHMGIEQGAKTMDEGHRADPGSWTRPRLLRCKPLLHRTEEEVQRQGFYGRVVLSINFISIPNERQGRLWAAVSWLP
jgi:hypothetical protein